MIKRIIEISNPARLSLKNQQMVVDRDGFKTTTVPIEDMGVLILDHAQISHTQGLFTACSENNVAVLICDGKHLPSTVLMPLDGNSLHSKIAVTLKILRLRHRAYIGRNYLVKIFAATRMGLE